MIKIVKEEIEINESLVSRLKVNRKRISFRNRKAKC